MNIISTEYQECVLFADYCVLRKIPIIHVANEGKRSYGTVMKLKRMGFAPGVPDYLIPVARGKFHGLWIEMKRSKGGVVSDKQLYWINLLQSHGYSAHIAKGGDEAIEILKNYLSLL